MQQAANVMTAPNGVTQSMSRHLASLRYEALPPELVHLTKQCVLDTLGVMIGASSLAPEAKLILKHVKNQEGRAESSLLGFGGKAPASWAIFMNGSLSHMLDYDDIGCGHPSAATVPVAFAVAERLGGVSGKDLITAICAGTDIMMRISHAIDLPDWTMTEGWFETQLLGYIGAAAVSGRLMGLDEEQMENALGIAFNQLCGSRQMAVGSATHMRSMQAGFSGQGGLLAADLAQLGIIGCKEILEGRYGIFNTYIRTNTPRWNALIDDLGTVFPIVQAHGFKVWPACATTRPTNAAAMHLRNSSGIRAEDIEQIIILAPDKSKSQLLTEPLELKRRPKTSIDGKYSIPFTTAVMLLRGNVMLRDYTDESLKDSAVLALAEKVTFRAEPSFIKSGIEIRTKDGRSHRHQPDGVPGDPKNPVDQKLLDDKFRDCVSFSAKAISATNVSQAMDKIANLENASDATDILRLLT